MVKWCIAQLEYAEMLNRVDPLRQELKSLEEAAVNKKNETGRMTALIAQLEASIAKYKAVVLARVNAAMILNRAPVYVSTQVDGVEY